MNKLLLVRHSQTEARPDIAKHEWGLTTEGQRRAESVAQMLEPYTPFVLASSPELKARQTAEPIARRYHLDVREVADLREHERQTVEWMGSEEVFRAIVIRFLERPDELVLGGETGRQALDRFMRGVNALIARHTDTNIVAVTHGSVITLFTAQVAGVDAVAFWQSLTQPWIGIFTLPGFNLLEMYTEFGRSYDCGYRLRRG